MKSKFQKKKEREREVRKKLLNRRLESQRKAREIRQTEAAANALRPRSTPIRSADQRKAREMRDMQIRMQLEHNQKILKAIEEEMAREEASPKVEGLRHKLSAGLEELKAIEEAIKKEEAAATVQEEKEDVPFAEASTGGNVGVSFIEKATAGLAEKLNPPQKKRRNYTPDIKS